MTVKPENSTYRPDRGIWHRTSSFILINLGIVMVLMLFFCPRCFLSWNGLKALFPDFLFSLAITVAMSYGGNKVETYYDDKISWIHHPVKRLFFTSFTYLTYAFLVSFVLVTSYVLIKGDVTIDNLPWRDLFDYALMPMGIALVFMALFTTRSWLLEWRKSALEAEILRNEKLASQYQSLKDQLNPHFLFNSLNVLSNLVYESPDKSAAFIQKLSRIYRYVLEAQKEELIGVEKEVNFAKNYLELQKIRFEDSLQFSIGIEDQEGWIPPLSLQLLLENAIKHNIISNENPLFIHIYRNQDELWISNTFQPKSSQSEPSTGIGLQNIKMRYQLISTRKMEVIQTEDEFLVKLPILELST
ncbi:histidine kinase [Algoriphagus halophytocola]|uniref:Histidine kinase n=1 Tax=Algoriphagus halophytocola TaxID=2991499 RepID=A0ABY6MCL3_9BACT|nr:MULTISPECIES: histidine kinase [unclassified Algoriphagus]UZD21441.1 histidine kinase [Algoriphagus sp. TR-M5]WBL42653.1 histidine kinase [Algoriphagus sp. TR-M9]